MYRDARLGTRRNPRTHRCLCATVREPRRPTISYDRYRYANHPRIIYLNACAPVCEPCQSVFSICVPSCLSAATGATQPPAAAAAAAATPADTRPTNFPREEAQACSCSWPPLPTSTLIDADAGAILVAGPAGNAIGRAAEVKEELLIPVAPTTQHATCKPAGDLSHPLETNQLSNSTDRPSLMWFVRLRLRLRYTTHWNEKGYSGMFRLVCTTDSTAVLPHFRYSG